MLRTDDANEERLDPPFGFYWELIWEKDPSQVVGDGFVKGALPQFKTQPGYRYRYVPLSVSPATTEGHSEANTSSAASTVPRTIPPQSRLVRAMGTVQHVPDEEADEAHEAETARERIR